MNNVINMVRVMEVVRLYNELNNKEMEEVLRILNLKNDLTPEHKHVLDNGGWA